MIIIIIMANTRPNPIEYSLSNHVAIIPSPISIRETAGKGIPIKANAPINKNPIKTVSPFGKLSKANNAANSFNSVGPTIKSSNKKYPVAIKELPFCMWVIGVTMDAAVELTQVSSIKVSPVLFVLTTFKQPWCISAEGSFQVKVKL